MKSSHQFRDTRLPRIRRPLSVLAALTLAVSAAALAAPPATHVVIGQADDAVDRAAIQTAIDLAQPGDTVELRGVFHLDGTPIVLRTTRLTLAGQTLDNDGDGLINEDGIDGSDNDGDGLVDEDEPDAVLVGVDDGSGGPAGDLFPARFNDGIEVLGLDDDLRHLVIRDLKLTRLNRSIYVFPDYDDGGTALVCASSAPTPGGVDNIDIVGNTFDNVARGVEVAGRVQNPTVRDNVFRSVASQAVILFGQELGCAAADGSIEDILPLDGPSNTRVLDNEIVGARIGVISFVTSRTTVRDNRIEPDLFAVVSLEDEKLSVAHNDISGAVVAFFASIEPFVDGPASGNSFSNNTLTANVFGGYIDCDTTGYSLVNNDYQGSFVVDVLLDGTAPGGACGSFGLGDSFENTVIATDFETTVLDFGRDNHLLGTLASENNPSTQTSVREELAGSSRRP